MGFFGTPPQIFKTIELHFYILKGGTHGEDKRTSSKTIPQVPGSVDRRVSGRRCAGPDRRNACRAVHSVQAFRRAVHEVAYEKAGEDVA